MENNYLDDIYKAVTGEGLIPNALVPLTVVPSGSTQHFEPPAPAYGFNLVDVQAVLLNEATINPSLEVQEVVPETGKTGLSKVTVTAVPLEEATVSPSTETQVLTPSAGKIGFSKVTVNPSAPSSSWKYYALCATTPMTVFSATEQENLLPVSCSLSSDMLSQSKLLHYKYSVMTGVRTFEVLDTQISDTTGYSWKQANSFFSNLYVYTDGDDYEGHVPIWDLDGFVQGEIYRFQYDFPTIQNPKWYAQPEVMKAYDSRDHIFVWGNQAYANEITPNNISYLQMYANIDGPFAVVKA